MDKQQFHKQLTKTPKALLREREREKKITFAEFYIGKVFTSTHFGVLFVF